MTTNFRIPALDTVEDYARLAAQQRELRAELAAVHEEQWRPRATASEAPAPSLARRLLQGDKSVLDIEHSRSQALEDDRAAQLSHRERVIEAALQELAPVLRTARREASAATYEQPQPKHAELVQNVAAALGRTLEACRELVAFEEAAGRASIDIPRPVDLPMLRYAHSLSNSPLKQWFSEAVAAGLLAANHVPPLRQ